MGKNIMRVRRLLSFLKLNRRGAIILEFAVLVPILVLALYMVLDISTMFSMRKKSSTALVLLSGLLNNVHQMDDSKEVLNKVSLYSMIESTHLHVFGFCQASGVTSFGPFEIVCRIYCIGGPQKIVRWGFQFCKSSLPACSSTASILSAANSCSYLTSGSFGQVSSNDGFDNVTIGAPFTLREYDSLRLVENQYAFFMQYAVVYRNNGQGQGLMYVPVAKLMNNKCLGSSEMLMVANINIAHDTLPDTEDSKVEQ